MSIEHTRALIAALRQAPIKRPRAPRQGRLPRQAQPDGIRLGYYRAILPFCTTARALFLRELPQILRDFRDSQREHEAKTKPKKDAARLDIGDASRARAAQVAIDRAASTLSDSVSQSDLFNVTKKFGQATTDHQKEQLDAQVRAAVGVSYASIEKPVRDRVEGWAATNVDLIKTVPDRYFDGLRQDVERAYAEGWTVDDLAERFEDEYGFQEDNAARIAADQIGKLNGQVNQDRQEALGVSKFVWRTMNDERVRETHSELEGEEFPWDEPPFDDESGEEITPGSAIRCRCYAEPVLDDLTGEDDNSDESSGESGGGDEGEGDEGEGDD